MANLHTDPRKKRKTGVRAALAAVLFLSIVGPETTKGYAQSLKPATQQEWSKIISLSALSFCYQVKNGVDQKTAILSNTAAVVSFLRDFHGGKLKDLPQATEKNIPKLAGAQIITVAERICKNNLNEKN